MLPRSSRLRNAATIRRVLAEGRGTASPHFALFCRASAGKQARGAVIVSRKVARQATRRNRLRRRLYEALRLAFVEKGGVECVVVARKEALEAPFSQLERGIRQALQP